MTYTINREQAKKDVEIYNQQHKKYNAINVAGLSVALLSVAALMVVTCVDMPIWYYITCIVVAALGGIVARCTDTKATKECIAARFLELEEKYKVLELKKTKMSSDGLYGGCFRVTAVTEDTEGNVSERYLGMVKGQYNTRYHDITLDINKEVLCFPYPPKEEV